MSPFPGSPLPASTRKPPWDEPEPGEYLDKETSLGGLFEYISRLLCDQRQGVVLNNGMNQPLRDFKTQILYLLENLVTIRYL